jgi:hypothetical protein
LSSAAVVSGGWESAVAANIRAGNSAVGPATGVLRAERRPATQCHLIQDLPSILLYFVAVTALIS